MITKSDGVHREEVWLRAWICTASAANCTEAKIATTWADKCLADFDARFTDPKRKELAAYMQAVEADST
jgi:hypothetical protein